MAILEKKSERKKIALIDLVKNGDYSIAFAMMEAERLNDEGKLLDKDYEEVMEYIENILNPVEDKQEVIEEIPEEIEEPVENETEQPDTTEEQDTENIESEREEE